MSTFSVVDPSQHAVLDPGFYWIEMAFDRPTSPDVLLRALQTIGFDSVGIEMEEISAGGRVGAVSAVSSSASLSAAAAQPVSTSVGPSTIQAASASTSATSAASPVQAAAVASPQGTDLRNPDVTIPPPVRRAVPATAPTSAAQSTTPTIRQAASAIRQPSTWTPFRDGTGAGAPPPPPPIPSGGDQPASPPSLPGGYDDASSDPYASGSYESPSGGGSGEDPGGGYYEGSPSDDASPAPRRAAAPQPSARVRAATPSTIQASDLTPPVPGAVLLNPQGGAPMWLCPPGTPWREISVGRMIVGGEGPAELPSGRSFRFVAHLGRAIEITSLPGLRWTIIHAIGFDPWAPMTFRLTPHTLTQGQLYDLRFLSRDKSAKQKKDVLARLVDMGFRPATLFLSKRNMRVPGRPMTTLSEWFGVGRWDGPDSVVVSSDPFYFAEARPTS